MNHVQVTLSPQTPEQIEIWIAMLNDMGFEGFEEHDAILKAFIPEEQFDKKALDHLFTGTNVQYQTVLIAPQNWNAEWEQSFEPVKVASFAAVRAGFHEPVTDVHYEIIITPKMSFGTGHHATTYLVMEQMGKMNFKDQSVFDFGTGTGVLAILAEKMGAKPILAIDNDEWSIDNASENILANHSQHIEIRKAELPDESRRFDIIIANINLNVILQNMPAIAASANPGGKILLSGFLYQDKAAITQSLEQNGLVYNDYMQKLDWICISASKP